MREVPDPQMFAVEYRVSCLPESHRMYKYLSLSVRRRGSKWVVEHMGDRGRYVSHTGEWFDIPVPFPNLDMAGVAALREARTLTFQGQTVDDVLSQ